VLFSRSNALISRAYLEPTVMLFLPLACIVRERAPDWPVLPAAKNMAVSFIADMSSVD